MAGKDGTEIIIEFGLIFLAPFNIDGFVKSRIFPFMWIPAYAGMTIKHLISIRYTIRHTREGGYPDVKKTFYEFINIIRIPLDGRGRVVRNLFAFARIPCSLSEQSGDLSAFGGSRLRGCGELYCQV